MEKDDFFTKSDKRIDGMGYYLPKVNMQVSFTRKAVAEDILTSTVKKAESAKATAKKAKTEARVAKLAAKIAKEKADAAKPTSSPSHDAYPELKKLYGLLAAEELVTAEALVKALINEDKAISVAIAARLQEGAIKFEDGITIKTLPASADTNQIFIARLDHSGFRSDDLKLQTNQAGLLQSANAVIEDKTADIIIQVAKIAIAAFKLASGIPVIPSSNVDPLAFVVAAAAPKKFCKSKVDKVNNKLERDTKAPSVLYQVKKPESIEIEFDPANLNEIAKINEVLCQLQSDLEIEVDSELNIKAYTEKADTGNNENITTEISKTKEFKETKDIPGLVYRMPIAYVAKVNQLILGDKREYIDHYPLKSTRIMLPNNGPVANLPYYADSCVTAKYDVSFTNGMPTKRDIIRPSEILECLRAPLAILEAFIALPTEMLQFKIDYSSKQEGFLKNQQATLEAQESLKKAQEGISNAVVPLQN